MRQKILAIFMVAIIALSAVPGGAVAAELEHSESAGTPNPMISADTTIEGYNQSWGDDPHYEDDGGTVVALPGEVNSTTDVDQLGNGHVNPYQFTVTDVDFSDASEFPRKSDESGDNKASALDASEYTSGANTTVSDVNTAPNVEAVEYDFQSGTSGRSATYGNFSVTADAEKRYFQAFYDVESASGASKVTVTVHDATDGDTAVVDLYNSSADTSSDDVGANSTGEGKSIQVQVGALSASGGDNTIDEIGKVVVSADGAANVDVSALNLEKTGKWKIGTEYVDTDDDDELETNEIYETTGPVNVKSVDSMGPAFDGATIQGLTVPMHYQASDLASEDVQSSFSDAENYPGFDKIGEIYYRLELPGAYDLSHANAELKTTTNWPGERYITVEMKEGVGTTDFSDISNWNDKTSTHSSQDKDVSLDSTISSDTEYALHYEIKLTNDEASAMQVSSTPTATESGGNGGILGSSGSGGGIVDAIFGLPGIFVAAVGTLAQRARGGWPFGG